MRLSDDNLRGRTVIGSDGLAIGEIAVLFLDSDAWRVESIQVRLRKEVADRLAKHIKMLDNALRYPHPREHSRRWWHD